LTQILKQETGDANDCNGFRLRLSDLGKLYPQESMSAHPSREKPRQDRRPAYFSGN
jgi:hypothetical protein